MGLETTFRQPFEEQISFFRQKISLPTERYDDITGAAHDRAFVVAGAMKADLLQDLRTAIDRSIAEGKSLAWYRKEFRSIVKKHGWSGWTGEGSKAGVNWRTRVTYQQNMLQSYAAGRHAQLKDPDLLSIAPYWTYRHRDGVANPRKQHQAWDGLTLHHTHPFWSSHYPPNGWGCHCYVDATTGPEYQEAVKANRGPDAAPAEGDVSGIDPGFGYAPGAGVKTQFSELIDRKLVNVDAPIGAAMMKELEPVVRAERLQAYQGWFDEVRAGGVPRGKSRTVGALSPRVVQQLQDNNALPTSAALEVRDEDVLHGLRDSKQVPLPEDFWRNLPEQLLAPQAVLLDRTHEKPALLYVFDLSPNVGKLVVTVDYDLQTRDPLTRQKITRKANIVRTGTLLKSVGALQDSVAYTLLEGTI